ncbi:MAG: type II toxin-antitoxin system RelE/ParE family toxin [Bacteroidota bacterium]
MVKKYKVVVTPRAQNAIRRIYDRLCLTESKTIATKVRRAINDTIKSLKTFPYSHEAEHLLNDGDHEKFRRALQWDYRIIYSIDEEEVIVSVVEVLHSAMSEQMILRKFGKS